MPPRPSLTAMRRNNAARLALDTIVWDLDGTLYEDIGVYDRYAEELGRFLPPGKRARYLADWAAAREGRGAARVGLGYDETRDRLFRFAGDRIVCFLDWNGQEEPAASEAPEAPGRDAPREAQSHTPRDTREGEDLHTPRDTREVAQPRTPVVEVPIFGPDRFNIGDLWGLPDALAAHYGVPRAERNRAFLATRAYMSSDAYLLQPEPRLREVLQELQAAGKRLVAMSNSPADTVEDVLDRLDIRLIFSLVASSSQKPAGLARFLEQAGAAERTLSIGDNFVNDIEPALRAGSHALYIDRHGTGLGMGAPSCYHVGSIQDALDWLIDHCCAGADGGP